MISFANRNIDSLQEIAMACRVVFILGCNSLNRILLIHIFSQIIVLLVDVQRSNFDGSNT